VSAAGELIRPNTRGIFPDLMTDSTFNEISRAFQDEGFTPDPECTRTVTPNCTPAAKPGSPPRPPSPGERPSRRSPGATGPDAAPTPAP